MEEKTLTLTVNIPADVYEQVRRIAEVSDRPIELVAADILEPQLPEFAPDADFDRLFNELDSYGDNKLWQTALAHLSAAHSLRLDELTDKGQEGILTEPDEKELGRLLELVDKQVLIRSKALSLLQDRGHDIKRYLGIAF
ncbi:MAG: hypothetical protein H7Y09_05440 [Chitinophagaceae bacterium]|nr:hypothetical protein [Anaerolineae bacterium]